MQPCSRIWLKSTVLIADHSWWDPQLEKHAFCDIFKWEAYQASFTQLGFQTVSSFHNLGVYIGFRRKRTLSEENENLNPVSLNKRPRYLSLQFKLFAIQLEFEKSSYILTTGLRGTWRGSQRTFPHSPLLPPLPSSVFILSLPSLTLSSWSSL